MDVVARSVEQRPLLVFQMAIGLRVVCCDVEVGLTHQFAYLRE